MNAITIKSQVLIVCVLRSIGLHPNKIPDEEEALTFRAYSHCSVNSLEKIEQAKTGIRGKNILLI